MRKYKALEVAVHAAPDKQISLTDPDARSMATSGKDTGMVGYNVQAAVDAKDHLIVAHEVTNIGNDRSQLSTMAKQAQEARNGSSRANPHRVERFLRRGNGPRSGGLPGGAEGIRTSDLRSAGTRALDRWQPPLRLGDLLGGHFSGDKR
jgi:hypothetical protein